VAIVILPVAEIQGTHATAVPDISTSQITLDLFCGIATK
jgi:hypothetical protein